MESVEALLRDINRRRGESDGFQGRNNRPQQDRWPVPPRLYESQLQYPGLSAYGRPLSSQHLIPETEYSPIATDRDGTYLDDCDHNVAEEPKPDRQWRAAQGITRLSLPPRSTATQQPIHRSLEDAFSSDPPRRHLSSCGNCDYPKILPKVQAYSNGVVAASSWHPTSVGNSPATPFNKFPSHHFQSSSSASFYPPSSPSNVASQRRAVQSRSHVEISTPKTLSRPHQPLLALEHAEPITNRLALKHSTPMVQGIRLVSLNELPDRFRSVFPFPIFNAVQSRCYSTVYNSNDNLVLSAPTGSGKTAIMELAVCKLVTSFESGQFKIIYMAPTKSLCTERHRDWQTKFKNLDLSCAELTGDTEQGHLRHVQSASIIITTPEKWDSMTRKWKDHARLMQLVKLFLIDEVHILKEARGATLEAVVSRMKSVGSNVRFIALSATVPNSVDIATWLGKNHDNQQIPAQEERFGEGFRPVKLQKFVYGLRFGGNDFAIESTCDQKLPEIIAKHADKKPMMIFCCTRAATMRTAKFLAKEWATQDARDRQWPAPHRIPVVADPDLKSSLQSGVAFHHAGLDGRDRQTIEKGFLEGNVLIICCTSTLAVGVNLPCHLVIIKNTVSWQSDGLKEYADLEMMQMLGRAGRPQFDSSAVAVIMTKQEKVQKYERLVAGEEVLESCLHLNLLDHLNAEIGLGTVRDLNTAKRWLAGTFLYVRLAQNPNHYKLDGDAPERSLDDRVGQICERDISLLQETELVLQNDKLKCTIFGEAMARYYVKFETMKGLLSLPPRAKISEILSVLADASEFHEVRFRAGEKGLYKALNSGSGIKFPIKIDIATSAQKRSIIIQSELGGVDFPADEQFGKHKRQYNQDKGILFNHIHRLIRCVVDCQVHLMDGPATRHALELARSLGARVWDNSPLQMRQVPGIGPVSVRRLVTANIKSIEALEATDAMRINMHLSKQPGYGEKILSTLKSFPKLRVSVKMMGKEVKAREPPKIRIKAEIGFLNDKIPQVFARKPVYICFLAERSDGHLVEFRRMSAKSIGSGEDILLSADVLDAQQYLTCYVMCDEIAGTMRYAELQHGLTDLSFPPPPSSDVRSETKPRNPKTGMNISRRRSRNNTDFVSARGIMEEGGEFSDTSIDDNEIAAMVDAADQADNMDFHHLETIERRAVESGKIRKTLSLVNGECGWPDWEPQRLNNGKWACNHKCKDKNACKHMCCREGLDRAPKAPKNSTGVLDYSNKRKELDINSHTIKNRGTVVQTVPDTVPARKSRITGVEVVDLVSNRVHDKFADSGPKQFRNLSKLHRNFVMTSPVHLINNKRSLLSNEKGIGGRISDADRSASKTSSDYGESWADDLPSPSTLFRRNDELDTSRNLTDGFHSLSDDDLSDFDAEFINPQTPLEFEAKQEPSLETSPQQEAEQNFHDGHKDLSFKNDPPLSDIPLSPATDLGYSAKLRDTVHQREIDGIFLSTSSPQKPSGLDTTPSHHQDKDCIKNQAGATDLGSLRPTKRQRVSFFGHSSISQTDLGSSIPASGATAAPELRPWDDMEGIDQDLLVELAEFCDFV